MGTDVHAGGHGGQDTGQVSALSEHVGEIRRHQRKGDLQQRVVDSAPYPDRDPADGQTQRDVTQRDTLPGARLAFQQDEPCGCGLQRP